MSVLNGLYGGNRLMEIPPDGRVITLADGAYRYSWVVLGDRNGHAIETTGSWTVYVLRQDAETIVESEHGTLRLGDTLQLEDRSATLHSRGGTSTLLISGVPGSGHESSRAETRPAVNQYRVAKPWGHELWLNGEHRRYVLKEVFIRAGNRTSLQYHRLKRETNLLTMGEARLVYRASGNGPLDATLADELRSVSMRPVCTLDVTPHVLHRIEAVTDVYLYETSTPHLDDVVRVQDDARRGDGRIAAEHMQ
jgi:mannose-6-phosphate isomerase